MNKNRVEKIRNLLLMEIRIFEPNVNSSNHPRFFFSRQENWVATNRLLLSVKINASFGSVNVESVNMEQKQLFHTKAHLVKLFERIEGKGRDGICLSEGIY